MSEKANENFGPLQDLIGVWKGDKGVDIAPEKYGSEKNPYFETITFSIVGDLKNAGSQTLWVLRYHQVVQRKSNSEVFHDETGYWMWDPDTQTVMHSVAIPRAVCVLAGGKYTGSKNAEGQVIIEVSASSNDAEWGIVQSPFMKSNARTTAFHHRITVGQGRLSYKETTILDIYGKTFDHTDENELLLA